jgi:hypothetical protein
MGLRSSAACGEGEQLVDDDAAAGELHALHDLIARVQLRRLGVLVQKVVRKVSRLRA